MELGNENQSTTAVATRLMNGTDVQFNDTHLSTLRTQARLFAASGMFPDAKSEAQAFVKIMAGRELGLTATFAMTKIYIVEGKVTVGAEIMAAKIKASKKYNYKVTKHDNNECIIDFSIDGELEYTSRFTMEDAKTAELIKPRGSWAKWPRPMLYSKALSQGARIVCPEIINGVYTFEDFGIESDEEGKPKDMSRVITVIPKEVLVKVPANAETVDMDEVSKDLAPGAYTHPQDNGAGVCPIHHIAMVNGQYGTYCPTKLPDGHWCKGKTVSETELVEPKNESKPARAKKEKQDPPTATQGDSAGTGLFKTDLDTIKSIGDLYAASLRDFPERFKLKADVLKALGKTETEITDPANDYIVLSTQSR